MFDNKKFTMIKELCKENKEFAEAYHELMEEECQMMENAKLEFRNRFALILGNMQLMETKDENLLENRNWLQLVSDVKEVYELLEKFSLYLINDETKSASMDIQKLVQEIFQDFRAICIIKELDMKLEVAKDAEEISKTYVTDYVKLKEILQSLIKNATETVEMGGNITVVIEKGKEDKLTISVKNSRTMVSNEQKKEIFEPKFHSQKGKNGLELPLCAKFTAMLNGTIEVDSTEQETKFQVCLPIAG